jgi:hypothetical protein
VAARPQQLGNAADSAVVDRRVLGTVHFVLATIVTFAYYTRADVFHPRSYYHSGDVALLVTCQAWVPYLISWIASRSLAGATYRDALLCGYRFGDRWLFRGPLSKCLRPISSSPDRGVHLRDTEFVCRCVDL